MTTTASVPSGPPTITKGNGPPEGTYLIPMDLNQPLEYDILYHQRVICGWGADRVDKFKTCMANGDRTLFWIALPPSHKSEQTPTFQRDGIEILPVGHVAIDKADDPEGDHKPDPTLVAADGSILMISLLFVLPAFNSLRLGAFAMDQCEMLVQQEPYGSRNCRAVALTSLSSRYYAGGLEGPDGMGRWETLGLAMPLREVAPWYKRRGYVKYKEEIRYGVDVKWYAQFMRKELGPPQTTS